MLLSHVQMQNELTERIKHLTVILDTINQRLSNNRALEQTDESLHFAQPILQLSLIDELTKANGNMSDSINDLSLVINVLDQLIGPGHSIIGAQPTGFPPSQPYPASESLDG